MAGAKKVHVDFIPQSVALNNEVLFRHGVTFNDLPLWQQRGIGLYWEEYDRPVENL